MSVYLESITKYKLIWKKASFNSGGMTLLGIQKLDFNAYNSTLYIKLSIFSRCYMLLRGVLTLIQSTCVIF